MRAVLAVVPLLCSCAGLTGKEPERVYAESPPTWFEDGKSLLSISPDAVSAVYRGRRRVQLIDLRDGLQYPEALLGSLDKVDDAVFAADGSLARLGSRGREQGWFLESGGQNRLSPLPGGSQPRWSMRGEAVYSEGSGLYFPDSPGRSFEMEGAIAAIAWSPEGDRVYALVQGADGLSSLVAVSPASGDVRTVAGELDAPASHNSIDVSPDGRTVFAALAGIGAPDPELRHDPDSNRDLDIYGVDTETGELQPVVQMPGDDLAPVVAGPFLYWTHNELDESVVVVPNTGGEAWTAVEDGQIPSWSPDGRRLGFTRGGWLVADWALNMDGAVVDVDADGRATSPPVDAITGYHEDFTPVWSPDGRWMAYHSHRAPGPVSGYSSPTSTDDIYIKRSSAPMDQEIRVTDFGWEVGMADWSPDGRRLVFSSWDRGSPLINRPWIATIDPETGEVLGVERVAVPPEVRNAHWLSWSPVRDEIAIEVVLEGEQRQIWVVDPETGTGVKILDYRASTYGGLDWTPDGETLVFSGLSEDRMQVFAVPRAGGRPRKLSADSASLMHPAVSPDGRLVACTRLLWSKEIWRLRIDG